MSKSKSMNKYLESKRFKQLFVCLSNGSAFLGHPVLLNFDVSKTV